MPLVVQQIIHVLSGQLHLANATPLSLLAAADHLSASVKWTVNIDRETARGEQRPCQREKEREGDGREGRRRRRRRGGDDGGMEGREKERGKRDGERVPASSQGN